LFELQRLGIQPGLDRIHKLLAQLDHPEKGLECVVVAGTNGKGTAATYLAQLGEAAGFRVGLYTSPHLLSIHERIQVDGHPISAVALAGLVHEARDAIQATGATFFEALTAIALLHFTRQGVELAVLEAGLGGRLDATGVVDAAAVLLTSVGKDHQHILGESIEEIAAEKLGLASPGRRFYLAPMPQELRSFALSFLSERGAVAVDLSEHSRPSIVVSQRGRAQRDLAATSAAMFEDLAAHRGWPRVDAAAALAVARVPCRYEQIGREPRLLIDTAHNEPALAGLLDQWEHEAPREDRILVLGLMRDKRVDDLLPRIAGTARTIYACAPRWYRSLPPNVLREKLVAAAGQQPTRIVASENVRTALEAAREEAHRRADAGGNPCVLVTGSNFVVAEALDRMGIDDLLAQPRAVLWDRGLPLRRRVTEAKTQARVAHS